MPLFSNFSDCINKQDARWPERSDLSTASLRPDWRKMGATCHSAGASESEPITGVLPGPRFGVMIFSSASLKPG